jgi:hypothetical protein
MFVGGLVAAIGVLVCGRWCLRLFCGVYEEMVEILRIVRGHWRRSFFFFKILFLWTFAFVYFLVISDHDFLVVSF